MLLNIRDSQEQLKKFRVLSRSTLQITHKLLHVSQTTHDVSAANGLCKSVTENKWNKMQREYLDEKKNARIESIRDRKLNLK